MRYKVGDKVLVRSDLHESREYGSQVFNYDMMKRRGKVLTIENVYKTVYSGFYGVEEYGGRWHWTDEMFVAPEDMTEAQRALMDAHKKEREFECGDKVQIRRDLHECRNWCGKSIDVNSYMEKHAGKWATVTKKQPRACRAGVIYLLDIDCGAWYWHESMFEIDPKEQVAEMFGCQLKEVPKDDYAIAGKPTLANDAVSHPSHYTDGRIEVIDFIQDKKLDFARGNVVKYIARAGKKGGSKSKEIEDLKKAKQYCEFAIRELEGRV